jgi:hypothetical protein
VEKMKKYIVLYTGFAGEIKTATLENENYHLANERAQHIVDFINNTFEPKKKCELISVQPIDSLEDWTND